MGQESTGSVLIVDDDAGIREMLRLVLETEGYHVETAADGLDALQRVRSVAERPNLILLDLNMPVMTGWEFRHQQRHDPAIADIPIAIISADRSLAQQHFSIDAVDYFRKPLDFPRLLALVDRVCRTA